MVRKRSANSSYLDLAFQDLWLYLNQPVTQLVGPLITSFTNFLTDLLSYWNKEDAVSTFHCIQDTQLGFNFSTFYILFKTLRDSNSNFSCWWVKVISCIDGPGSHHRLTLTTPRMASVMLDFFQVQVQVYLLTIFFLLNTVKYIYKMFV